MRAIVKTLVVVWLLCASTMGPARADTLSAATEAYFRGDYIRAASRLSVLALRGDPRAQGRLGFMYENGFGVPQAYEAAADLYQRAALRGDAFAQCRLGLLYDKGHGVPPNLVLAFKWLDLAAAHAPRGERDFYARLRNAVASKMSSAQIIEGQRLALFWGPQRDGPAY